MIYVKYNKRFYYNEVFVILNFEKVKLWHLFVEQYIRIIMNKDGIAMKLKTIKHFNMQMQISDITKQLHFLYFTGISLISKLS